MMVDENLPGGGVRQHVLQPFYPGKTVAVQADEQVRFRQAIPGGIGLPGRHDGLDPIDQETQAGGNRIGINDPDIGPIDALQEGLKRHRAPDRISIGMGMGHERHPLRLGEETV